MGLGTGACQVKWFDLAGLVPDLAECWLTGRKLETGLSGDSHRLRFIPLEAVGWWEGVGLL